MNETKFMNGPWVVVDAESGNRDPDGISVAVGDDASDGPFVAHCEPHSDYGAVKANARLIAAAPELYEVCKRLLSASESRLLSPSHRAWDECRAAIAKAEGKE